MALCYQVSEDEFQVVPAILRIPTDVLLEIFRHFIPGTGGIMIPPHPFDGFWTLRQICSAWRDLALSSSWLWNRISLDSDEIDENLEEDAVLQKWTSKIKLAHYILPKTGPVELTLMLGCSDSNSNFGIIQTISAQLVKPLAARINGIYVQANFLASATLIRHLLDTKLRRLHLDWTDFFDNEESSILTLALYSPDKLKIFQRFLEQAPSLRDLSITGWNFLFWLIPPSSVPWNQLTHLTLMQSEDSSYHEFRPSYPYEDALRHLNLCTALTDLALQPAISRTTDILGNRKGQIKVSLHTLQRCVLYIQDPDDWTFLDYFSAGKALSSFKVHGFAASIVDEPVPVSKILKFLDRSSCAHSLEVLQLFPSYLIPGASPPSFPITNINAAAPMVKELALPCTITMEDLITISQGTTFSALRRLDCYFAMEENVFLQSLEPRFMPNNQHGRIEILRGYTTSQASNSSELAEYISFMGSAYNVSIQLHHI